MNHRNELGEILLKLGLTNAGVEIGVLYGEFSEKILSTWPGTLHLVDPWIQQPAKVYKDGTNAVDFDDAMERCRRRLAPFGERAKFWRMFSVEAAAGFKDGTLDFVYEDGNHAPEAVAASLRAWWPKIKAGGILGGHDYMDGENDYWRCGVKTAVTAFALEHKLVVRETPACTSWWIAKPL